ncbi:hypothetical protein ACQ7CQ_20445 [Escherichia coli]|uniref:hypothetical protein n=1 Tax=Escherichia coli TaxID=562 RepID=UPI003D3356F2
MNDIRLKFRTAVRVTVPVTDGWPEDAIACTQSAQTEFSGRRVILVPESRLQGQIASAQALQ